MTLPLMTTTEGGGLATVRYVRYGRRSAEQRTAQPFIPKNESEAN